LQLICLDTTRSDLICDPTMHVHILPDRGSSGRAVRHVGLHLKWHTMKKLVFLALGLLASCSVESLSSQQEADGDAAYRAARQEQQGILLRCVRTQCTWTRTAGASDPSSAAATIDALPRPAPQKEIAVHTKQAAASPGHDNAGRTARSGFQSSSCEQRDRTRRHQCLAHAAHRNAPSRRGSFES